MSIIVTKIHASGPIPGVHVVFSLGAVLMDIHTQKILATLDLVLKCPDAYAWRMSTLEFWNSDKMKSAHNKLFMETKPDDQLSTKEAMDKYVDFLKDSKRVDASVVLCFDGMGFDVPMINNMLDKSGYDLITYIFGEYNPVVDIHSYHMGVGKMAYKQGVWNVQDAACKALGDPNLLLSNPFQVTYNSCDDACKVAWDHCKILTEVEKQQ